MAHHPSKLCLAVLVVCHAGKCRFAGCTNVIDPETTRPVVLAGAGELAEAGGGGAQLWTGGDVGV